MKVSIEIFHLYNDYEIKFFQKSAFPFITINIETHTGDIRYIDILHVKGIPTITKSSISGYRNITKIKRVQREYQKMINTLIKKVQNET